MWAEASDISSRKSDSTTINGQKYLLKSMVRSLSGIKRIQFFIPNFQNILKCNCLYISPHRVIPKQIAGEEDAQSHFCVIVYFNMLAAQIYAQNFQKRLEAYDMANFDTALKYLL